MAQATSNISPDITDIQAEALDNARNGQSVMNYPAIFEGFMAKGIGEANIRPRENVLTFNAWKALGRSVKKGEHGVRVVTFVPVKDQETGEVTGRRKHTAVVFHITQTELTSEWEARRASKPQGEWHRDARGRSYYKRNETREPCGPLGIRFAHDIELIEPIRPIDFVLFIRNVNSRPSIAHEIGGLEDGSCGGIPSEFRTAAAGVFTVDGK